MDGFYNVSLVTETLPKKTYRFTVLGLNKKLFADTTNHWNSDLSFLQDPGTNELIVKRLIAQEREACDRHKKSRCWCLYAQHRFVTKKNEVLLMAEILHQFIGSLSHYL